MHPKFSLWIDHLQNQHFFKERKIRMICPPKVNNPIISREKDLTLDRNHRVALIPPTEDIVIMLNKLDKEFVAKEFPHKLRDIKKSNQACKLWLKIIHVEIAATGGASKSNRTDIYLVDMSSENLTAILTLYDDRTTLASIFRRNDYMGLTNPSIQQARGENQETIFEYANDTVIFLMPEKEAQEAVLAKKNLTSLVEEEDGNSTSDQAKKDIAERDEEVGFFFFFVAVMKVYFYER